MTTIRLIPCRFCGSDQNTARSTSHRTEFGEVSVIECPDCGATVSWPTGVYQAVDNYNNGVRVSGGRQASLFGSDGSGGAA